MFITTIPLLLLPLVFQQIMSPPRITVDQLSEGINGLATEPNVKTVLEGLLNDFMDLQYGQSTPYTTGKQILPTGVTIDNVTEGLKDRKAPEFVRGVLAKIADTHARGDLTPQANDGSWDPKFTPVLQLVSAPDHTAALK